MLRYSTATSATTQPALIKLDWEHKLNQQGQACKAPTMCWPQLFVSASHSCAELQPNRQHAVCGQDTTTLACHNAMYTHHVLAPALCQCLPQLPLRQRAVGNTLAVKVWRQHHLLAVWLAHQLTEEGVGVFYIEAPDEIWVSGKAVTPAAAAASAAAAAAVLEANGAKAYQQRLILALPRLYARNIRVGIDTCAGVHL
jgi:hypothetical protein